MTAKAKHSPSARAADSFPASGGGRAGVPSLKTKGPKHFAETMQIAERIMDERRELFRRLADA